MGRSEMYGGQDGWLRVMIGLTFIGYGVYLGLKAAGWL